MRGRAEEALMRGAALHNDREARQGYLDFVTAIAEAVLSCGHVEAAKTTYIGLYAAYAQLSEEEIGEEFGQDVLAHIRQVTAFENEVKLGGSGESIKPFLPGVQAHLAAEMIVGAKVYQNYEGDPEIIRHYVSAILTGAKALDDENLDPPLRLKLKQAQENLTALAEKFGGPGMIEGATLTARGEVRKPTS